MRKKNLLNWEMVVDKGFGNQNNIGAWSMAKYKDHLYVGTLNFVNGCQVYRSKTGDKGSWQQVNQNGFGDKRSTGARTMIVYKNLLWVVTFSPKRGTQVWITNGEDSVRKGLLIWKQANIDGFGEGRNIYASRAMVVYKNKLYVGTQVRKGLPFIYRYNGLTDYDKIQPDKWDCINKDWQYNLSDIPEFSLIGKLVNFKTPDGKEYIYAGIYPEIAAKIGNLNRVFHLKVFMKIIEFFTLLRCNIWRYDGITWKKVGKPGFGKLNVMTMSAVVSNNKIYFGTSNIFGAEIWKSENGVNWTRVMKKGFRFPMNISVYELNTFENRLIVGMQNQWFGCQIWASIKENPVNNNDFVQLSRAAMREIKQVNPLKLKQDGIKVFETFNSNLYAGTVSNINIFKKDTLGPGCEVWRISNL